MLIPVALLEAMARGTICFVSDLPNLEQFVTHSHNALVFPSSDTEQLRQMIEKYGSDEAIAKNAYEFAKNYPSFEQIAEKYYQLI